MKGGIVFKKFDLLKLVIVDNVKEKEYIKGVGLKDSKILKLEFFV